MRSSAAPWAAQHAPRSSRNTRSNRYRDEQLDSRNGTTLSANRFFSETEFAPRWLRDKVVLDAGCGAGRFAEIACRHAAHLVVVDISSAVEATQANLRDQPSVDVV